MMKKVTFFLGLLAFVISGCKKPITQPNSGIYRGTFFQIFDNGDTNAQGIANLALSGDTFGGTFTLSGDTTTGSPVSCNGVYEINGTTQITFTNTAIVPDLGYQPHYILDTVYQYTFDDHDFTLDMVQDTTRYEYKLIRN
jgi:hypothetical protein